MKKIRKTMSIVSAAAILASIAAMPVSAAGINAYSVSYETLTSAITTDDGSTVPAGAVAVTMSIDNNTGFNANTLTLDIDEGYSVLTNNDGKPIVDKGAVLANAMTSAAVSDDEATLCVVSASAMTSNVDGALFTVYFTADSATTATSFVSIEDTDAEIATGEISMVSSTTVVPTSTATTVFDTYIIGDTNNEELVRNEDNEVMYAPVDSVDAANILMLLAEYGRDFDVVGMNWDIVDGYFEEASHYSAPDADQSKYIDNVDAADILDYSSMVGAGSVANYTGSIGREITFIVPAERLHLYPSE